MKNVYVVLVNTLLFFFIATIINGIRITGGSVLSIILVGGLFGLLMMSVPLILRFFKISVTTGSRMLLALVLSFLFFFFLHSGFMGIAKIVGSSIDLGIGGGPIKLAGSLETLMVASLTAALASVGLQRMSEG
jgi:hypothetical protein